ncbi:phosphotransferase enzyme family protein [Frigidibacter sp. ROC022]|uniref:phosphotransferase enzyme family protein n=1 Tax=Frigidibacter sp. ROC022 TaxID=2971796 RepID=UPI00215B4EB5|nr:phosphotransferase [Frigidibacter sp. ROC022]MCR8724707.1 phosphotransferase [Frigidibacter sp. ROC022]
MTEALQAEALSVLAHWGPLAEAPRLIKHRENAVFEVHLADGAHAALRLHRPGYQSDAAIRSELWWCQALAAAGFPAAEPLPTRAGALLVPGPRHAASLIRWCDGQPLGAAGEPLPPEAPALYHRLGALIADLHDATDRLTLPPGFTRPTWDAEGFLGEAPLWGRFWDSPALSGPDRALLTRARDAALRALEALESPDFGLIHADVLRENVLVADGRLTLIDFDDSGFGYRFYDLATALSQGSDDPGLAPVARALLDGYARHRPLPPEAPRLLTLFCLLRAMASVGWLASRAAPDDPRQKGYIARATRLAELWLQGQTLS